MVFAVAALLTVQVVERAVHLRQRLHPAHATLLDDTQMPVLRAQPQPARAILRERQHRHPGVGGLDHRRMEIGDRGARGDDDGDRPLRAQRES